jgi:transcriptional regulator with XRE-family HTH domain
MLRLKVTRMSRGLSQWELGRAAGMSQGRFSMIERGLVTPTGEERAALAQALGTSAATLLRRVFGSRTPSTGSTVPRQEVEPAP